MKFHIASFLLSIASLGVYACSDNEADKSPLSSEKATDIYGIVVDSETSEPIRGAQVQLFSESSMITSTVTFDDGHFEMIVKQPSGAYNLLFSILGYDNLDYALNISAGHYTHVDIAMERSSVGLTPITKNASIKYRTMVTLNGSVTKVNPNRNIIESGFLYGTNSNLIENGIKIVSQYTTFLSSSIELEAGTYYYAAYASNEYGTAYGDTKSFTIESCAPEIETLKAQNITESTALISAEILYYGDPKIIEMGFVASNIYSSPTIENCSQQVIATSVNGNIFSSLLDGLTQNTQYHVCAYAKNNDSVSYGKPISFNTDRDDVITREQWYEIGNLAIQKHELSYSSNWNDAHRLCSNSIIGGYNNWRLPTATELQFLDTYKRKLGLSGAYWSSTDYYHTYFQAYYYYYVIFSDTESCRSSYDPPKNVYYVRAVRTIN